MNVVGAPTLAGSGAQDHCSRYHCAKIGKFIKAENFSIGASPKRRFRVRPPIACFPSRNRLPMLALRKRRSIHSWVQLVLLQSMPRTREGDRSSHEFGVRHSQQSGRDSGPRGIIQLHDGVRAAFALS